MKIKKECKICKSLTSNKVYCSEKCQHEGYRSRKPKPCEKCGKPMLNLRFCSYDCYSETNSQLRKEHIATHGHSSAGLIVSDETKLKHSISSKKMWANPEIRSKILTSLQKTRESLEYPLGWSPEARQKRIETNLRLFGVSHNFSGNFGQRQCDKTFVENYGMTSVEYRQQKLIESYKTGNKTNIETIVENILNKYNIKYKYQHFYRGRNFDFCLLDLNILIECDGVYHHGKNIPFEQLNELQLKTFHNDRYKDNLVQKNNEFKLIRYWGDDIESPNFEQMIKKLWEK